MQNVTTISSTGPQTLTYTPYKKAATIAEDNNTLEFTYGADYERIKTILKTNGATAETRYYFGNYERQVVGATTNLVSCAEHLNCQYGPALPDHIQLSSVHPSSILHLLKNQTMKLFFFFLMLLPLKLIAQQLPAGSCGIVNVYDANGARTKRVYFCNNGSAPYPQKAAQPTAKETTEILQVEALYPNPTTGKFSIEFNQPLDGAIIQILDASNKVLQTSKANGQKANFDVSPLAAGVYFVKIKQGKMLITKKLVKQ